ncbi:MAG: GntR family transcriptional regulator [Hyphomicrobium sp.]|nr:GntR family transcriptional regulator [Hyphomicrobium sp.]
MRYQSALDAPRAAPAQPLTPLPLYVQVRNALLENIRDGEWMVGDSLPNEQDLAKRFAVSIGTIRKAIEGLEASGLVQRIQGRGTYIAGVGSHVLKEKFMRLRSSDGRPLAIKHELLAVTRTRATPVISKSFNLAHGEADVFEVRQRLISGNEPVGLETSFLKSRKLPNFTQQMTFGQDLYAVLADFGEIITHASDCLSLVPLEIEDAAALDVPPTSLAMRLTRHAFGIDNVPIEVRIAHYRADKFTYLVDIS